MAEPGSYKTQDADGQWRTFDEHRAWLAGKKQAGDDLETYLIEQLNKQLDSIVTRTIFTLESFAAEERLGLKTALADMQTGIAATQAKAFDELKAELFRHAEAELAAAVRDVRGTHEGIERQAERIASKAAERACERAVVNLLRDVDELRAELAELKAERNQLRAIR